MPVRKARLLPRSQLQALEMALDAQVVLGDPVLAIK